MVKGIYNPDYNGFNSDYTIKELCEMRAEKADGEYSYSYEICGDNAIIYKLKDGERIAFAELCDISALDKGQKYLFTNGIFSIGETTIIAPYHLAREQFWGERLEIIKLQDNVGFNAIVEFYKFGAYYNIAVEDNSITLERNNEKVAISYNANEHSIHYSIVG